MFQAYSQLCPQGLIIITPGRFGEAYEVSGIELNSVAFKVSALLTALSLQPSKGFLHIFLVILVSGFAFKYINLFWVDF